MALKVVGSNPIIYPELLEINFIRLKWFKKTKKKILKKNINVVRSIAFLKKDFSLKKSKFFDYKNYSCKMLSNVNNRFIKENLFFSLSKKKYNPKALVFFKKNINTFTIGSITKYLKIKKGKFFRRSFLGLKILINVLKNILNKRFYKFYGNFFLKLNGSSFNLNKSRFLISRIFKKKLLKENMSIFFLINLKISFTKVKFKKKKSIKKRLKKKILKTFLKTLT